MIEDTKNELEQLVKRDGESEQTEEETEDPDTDETLGERIEEARGILEKLDEARREAKDGNEIQLNCPFFLNIYYFLKLVWMMNF